MRFTGTLPQGFVLSKPITQDNYEKDLPCRLEKEGRLIITRKRDGWKLFAATDARGRVRLYTDGMNEVDERLDHIRKDVAAMRLPSCTLLVGEIVFDRDDSDELGGVQSVMSASLEKALAYQKANGRLRYMLFDVLFMKGKRIASLYRYNLAMLRDLVGDGLPHVFTVPELKVSFAEAQKMVRARGWEGLVLYDARFSAEIRLDGGTPKRAAGCYKWKPIFEDDFIVREKILRPDPAEVKKLVLLQIDPATKKEFGCGKLGSFTKEKRRELAAAKYPLVVQAEFEARYPKSGKIRNARFVRVRADKKVADCIAPKSFGSGS